MPRNKYTSDQLLYESFYVSIVNSLFVAASPFFIFFFLCAVEDYPMTNSLFLTFVGISHLVFIISFFVNFFYYAYFIRKRNWIVYGAAVVTTCALGFVMFFSDFEEAFTNTTSAVIFTAWFLLLAVMMIANRVGKFANTPNSRYEEESWLYKHALVRSNDDSEDTVTIEDVYTPHKYIDHHDEDEPDAPAPVVDLENDPKRASRLTW